MMMVGAGVAFRFADSFEVLAGYQSEVRSDGFGYSARAGLRYVF